MLSVGLTGGIATGKSHVLGRWRARGVPVVDADALAREALAPDSPGALRVIERFGPDVVDPRGGVDRRRLAAIVFDDDQARADLEAIVHPQVVADITRWMEARRQAAVRWAVAEVPLLFEAGLAGRFNQIVVVACAPEEQLRRLVDRDGLLRGEAESRLRAQWPIERKVALADQIIRTDGPIAETDRQADAVFRLYDEG